MNVASSPVGAHTARLALSFDEQKLVEALEQIGGYEMREDRPVRDPLSYVKWGGASLHAVGGEWSDFNPCDAALEGFRETELVRVAPYFKQVLDTLDCAKQSVRIAVLWPGGRISPHCDDYVGFANGLLRLHIPIVTSPEFHFFIEDEPCRWAPGELWYGDFSRSHHGWHAGTEPRVHIVADVCINDFVLGLFPDQVIARHREILRYEPAVALSHAELDRNACRFVISRHAAAGLPGLDWVPAALGDEFTVDVRRAEDRLVISVAGEQRAALEPVGPSRFRILGCPPSIQLSFGADDPTARTICLRTPVGSLAFPAHAPG